MEHGTSGNTRGRMSIEVDPGEARKLAVEVEAKQYKTSAEVAGEAVEQAMRILSTEGIHHPTAKQIAGVVEELVDQAISDGAIDDSGYGTYGWRVTPNGRALQLTPADLDEGRPDQSTSVEGMVKLAFDPDTKRGELGDLVGKLLTIADAIGRDEEQRKAIKGLIRQYVFAWVGDLERDALADAHGPWNVGPPHGGLDDLTLILHQAELRRRPAGAEPPEGDPEAGVIVAQWADRMVAIQRKIDAAVTAEVRDRHLIELSVALANRPREVDRLITMFGKAAPLAEIHLADGPYAPTSPEG